MATTRIVFANGPQALVNKTPSATCPNCRARIDTDSLNRTLNDFNIHTNNQNSNQHGLQIDHDLREIELRSSNQKFMGLLGLESYLNSGLLLASVSQF